MADPTRPNSFADGQVIDALRMNQDFDAIYDWAKNQAMHKDGSKSFTALPSGPGGGAVPISDAQLANKLYVDNAVANVSGGGGGGTGTAWTSSNDGAGSGMDADLLDGVQGSSYARTDVSTETFSGRVGVANGSTGGPGFYFNAAPTTGLFYNNGLSLAAGGQECIGINAASGGINLNKPIKAYGLVSSSKGGTTVYNSTSDYDLYRYTSTIKSKDNVRRKGDQGDTTTEYVAKMLATDLATWDAQVLAEQDGETVRRPAGKKGKKQDRGTANDRLGPIVEDMDLTWPEAVLYDENDQPISLDESLIVATLWAAVKGLVSTLKDAEVLPQAWPEKA